MLIIPIVVNFYMYLLYYCTLGPLGCYISINKSKLGNKLQGVTKISIVVKIICRYTACACPRARASVPLSNMFRPFITRARCRIPPFNCRPPVILGSTGGLLYFDINPVLQLPLPGGPPPTYS